MKLVFCHVCSVFFVPNWLDVKRHMLVDTPFRREEFLTEISHSRCVATALPFSSYCPSQSHLERLSILNGNAVQPR
eukprot:5081320-Heterocapsa_arctica.AAC.1